MKRSECGPLDEIFAHEDAHTGEVRIFNATALNQHIDRFPSAARLMTLDLEPWFTGFIRAERGIEGWRIDRLCEPHLSRPILLVEMPNGSHLTVDGHHRWIKKVELGHATIEAYAFPLGEWERFLVTDLMAP
jgi:hypothetical protein